MKTNPMPNNRYDYGRDSVYAIVAGGKRKTFICARVSADKQK